MAITDADLRITDYKYGIETLKQILNVDYNYGFGILKWILNVA